MAETRPYDRFAKIPGFFGEESQDLARKGTETGNLDTQQDCPWGKDSRFLWRGL